MSATPLTEARVEPIVDSVGLAHALPREARRPLLASAALLAGVDGLMFVAGSVAAQPARKKTVSNVVVFLVMGAAPGS